MSGAAPNSPAPSRGRGRFRCSAPGRARQRRRIQQEQRRPALEENVLCSVTSKFHIIGVPTLGCTSVSILSLLHLHIRVESNIGV